MEAKEITKELFDSFSKNHPLGNFYQTSEYGTFMSKYDYKDIYIGVYDDKNLVAASLILSKTISLNVKYGYAPRGFLMDYFNEYNLKEITLAIKKYFKTKGYAFIKVNPIITLSEVNPVDGSKNYSERAIRLMDTLETLGYIKLKDNIYFESVLPKYNPIVNLKSFDLDSLDNKLKNKINRVSSKGLVLIKGDIYNANSLYELVKRKDDVSDEYYKTLYKSFASNDMIDLFLLDVDYHKYLLCLQEDYNTESEINEKINKIFQMDPSNKSIYNEKMVSDQKLNEINEELVKANAKIQNGVLKETVAGALVIKYNNIAYLYTSGFDKTYNRMFPNHYLHYCLLKYYKDKGFAYADLNGITGDFTKENPYRGLNEFKLSYNPRVYEYIGEFDLVISDTKYKLLWSTKALHKEFEKRGLKTVS